MSTRHIVILSSLVSIAAAEEPAPSRGQPSAEMKTPTALEPPIVVPSRPSKASPRFVQRRLGRPAPGAGTPLIWCPTARPALVPATRTFAFDPDAPRFTQWPGPSCAWLVRDLDGDGEVTTGRELFGSFTSSRGELARDGFTALAALDENKDGVVDSHDAAHTTLMLWFDRNSDRRTGRGELQTLGSRVLPLEYEVDERCDVLSNCVRERVRLKEGWLLDLHLKLFAAPAT